MINTYLNDLDAFISANDACGKSCCRGHLANKTCQDKGF